MDGARWQDHPRSTGSSGGDDSPDLEALFQRYRENADLDSLARLFERTNGYLYGQARRVVDDDLLAEDIVQDTFVILIERADGFDPSRPLLPYLVGIVRRRALRTQPRWSPDGARVAEHLSAEHAQTIPSDAPDIHEVVGLVESARVILRALREIPRPYGETLRLYLEQDLGATEIGARLDREPSTVRVQIHRGLAMLRARLPWRFAQLLAAGSVAGQIRASNALTLPPTPPARTIAAGGRVSLTSFATAILCAIAATLLVTNWWSAADELPTADHAPLVGELQASRGQARETRPDPAVRETLRAWPWAGMHLQFVDETGALVPSVSAVLAPAGHDVELAGTVIHADTEGIVELPDVAAGVYSLVVDRGTTIRFERTAERAQYERVTLPSGVTVRGEVRDERGDPVPNARIWLADPALENPFGGICSVADGAGHFEVCAVQPLSTLAAVDPTSGRMSRQQLVSGLPDQFVGLQLLPHPIGSVRGRILGSDGQPLARATVHVGNLPRLRYDPTEDGGSRLSFPPRVAYTDAHGRFVADGVPDGPVTIVARARNHRPGLLAADRRVLGAEHVIQLERGVRIEGTCVDEHGRPVPNALVRFEPAEHAHEWAAVRSDEQGRFALDALPPRTRLLVAEADGHDSVHAEIRPHHASGAPLTITFDDEHPIRVRLIPTDGGELPQHEMPLQVGVFDVGDNPSIVPPHTLVVDGDGRVSIDATARRRVMQSRQLTWCLRGAGQPDWIPIPSHRRTLEDGRIRIELHLPRDFAESTELTGELATRDAAAAARDLWLVAGRDGWWRRRALEFQSDGRTFSTAPLPCGTYRVMLMSRDGVLPSLDLGEHRVAPGAPYALGSIDARSGSLAYSIEQTDGQTPESVVAWLRSERNPSFEFPLPIRPGTEPEGVVAIAPGSYRLFVTSTSFMPIHGRHVVIEEGERTEVRIVRAPASTRYVSCSVPASLRREHASGELRDENGESFPITFVDLEQDGDCGFWITLAVGRYRLSLGDGETDVRGEFTVVRTDSARPIDVQMLVHD